MQLIKAMPRRDVIAIGISLGSITLLSWVYLFSMASGMTMPQDAMQTPHWDAHYFLMMFLMWSIMMVGMMLPSVAPTVLIYASIARKSIAEGMPVAPVGAFVSGYLAMWILFSLFATSAQWGLDQAALLSPMLVSNSSELAALLIATAGVYQWLPIKDQCLQQCRSPVNFITTHWRKGKMGAFRMGVSHGAYCLGCCWVLMSLLFVGGVMNLLCIATITLFVLLEKILPLGDTGGRVLGGGMILTGVIIALI